MGLLGLALILTIIITGLIGNAIAISVGGSPSAINFCMFVAVISWLAIIFGFAVDFFLGSLAGVAAIVEGVVALFSVIAGIVLAAKLGVHSCGNHGYVSSNSLTKGANDQKSRCHELQASCAFFWFLFATYLASALLAFMSGGSGLASRGGIRKGASGV